MQSIQGENEKQSLKWCFGISFVELKFHRQKISPDPYLEMLLDVNINFKVRLTLILANYGIYPRETVSGSSLFKFIVDILSLADMFIAVDLQSIINPLSGTT